MLNSVAPWLVSNRVEPWPALLLFPALLFAPAVIYAQDPVPPLPPEPKPLIVFDARLGWPGFKRDEAVAANLGVTSDDLPGRGLGLIAGATLLVARSRTVSLGIGGEILWARAGRTAQPLLGETEGPSLKTRWSAISPQLSLNFGKRDGWSYLTGGIGSSKLTMEREDERQGRGSRVRTINYGGGARWFTNNRLALNLDLRFYSIDAQEGAIDQIPTPKMRMFLVSGGISIR